ncbi:C4-dicarboxylate transport transcriptional regulatory protein DctD [Magnetospira thiophila]
MDEVKRVLLVDDEDEVRHSVSQTLKLEGFEVESFEDSQQALAALSADWRGIVITDLKMPRLDGMGVLAHIMKLDADLPVVILTAHGDIPIAVQAMRDGAYGFMEKTADPDHLITMARQALEKRQLVLENRDLRRQLEATGALEGRIIGKSPVMERLRSTVLNLANTDVDILLVGETGTGKEVVARCLHDFGPRGEKPFVALNCGALAEGVIESELFGHEAGAFTGALNRRIGKLEYAEGGTLFLDEIESMPPSVQVRLLRVLQERSLERVGGNKPVALNIRIVAASKVDLSKAVADGLFREDLMYRLQVAQIELPPLRQRLEDLPLLYSHFTDVAALRYRRPNPPMEPGMLHDLMGRSWPGNVRELRNTAERSVLGLGEPGTITSEIPSEDSHQYLYAQMERFEQTAIKEALRVHGGRIAETAAALGLHRKTLYLRMQKYDLISADFK